MMIGYRKLIHPVFKRCRQTTIVNGFMFVNMNQIITDRLNGLRVGFPEQNRGMTKGANGFF